MRCPRHTVWANTRCCWRTRFVRCRSALLSEASRCVGALVGRPTGATTIARIPIRTDGRGCSGRRGAGTLEGRPTHGLSIHFANSICHSVPCYVDPRDGIPFRPTCDPPSCYPLHFLLINLCAIRKEFLFYTGGMDSVALADVVKSTEFYAILPALPAGAEQGNQR